MVSVSERQIKDTFNDTFHNDINKHRAILTQKWTIFKNKIDVLCLFNYIILKIACPEQNIKRLIGKKSQQFDYVLFLKMTFSFVYKYVGI